METLKAQQLIVLVALLVSLVGTLLLLGKINEHGQSVGATSAGVEMRVLQTKNVERNTQKADAETVVHVIGN
ncbi:hypothetical protein HZA99_02920, partial [Candidatus Woesearchaeota archaeon]|nr:hypothetical protein [Candidatus Woesearchaeota archaeon]